MFTQSAECYEDLFTEEHEEAQLDNLRDKGILRYRTKTIKSGDMLECEIYPVWRTSRGGSRAAKENPSRKAQKNLNDKNIKKWVVRLTNTNFTDKDIWATFTYDNEHLPANEAEAKKDIQNYIRRLKDYIRKNGLPALKYIYVTEYHADGDGKTVRVHHHMIMNFRDRDIAESIWTKGGRTQTRRLQPDDYGLEGLARYITKTPQEKKCPAASQAAKSSKRFTASLNLDKPIETISDTKISRGRAEKMASNPNSAREVFQKLYDGYLFNDMAVRYSDFVSGVYLYVRMRRAPDIKSFGKLIDATQTKKPTVLRDAALCKTKIEA